MTSTLYEIRPYLSDDFKNVYYLIKLTHKLDSISIDLLHEKIDDCTEDAQLKLCVLSKNHEIIGFAQAVIRYIQGKPTGFLKLIGVLPEFQNQGIGRQLLTRIELFCRQQGAQTLRFYDSPKNYLNPGIDPFYTQAIVFAERNGFFKFADTSNLICTLNQDWNTEEDENILLNQQIVVKRAEDSDLSDLLSWIQQEFPLWETELTRSLNRSPKAVHIAYHESNVIAFSAHSGNNVGLDWFGPMGTSTKARGKGVGSVLLKRCLLDLKNQGFNEAVIPWVGPIPFYVQQAKAKMSRVFWRYQKKLN